MHNSIPKLLRELRPGLKEIAGWVGVSRGLGNFWLAGTYLPKAPDRARLVKAVRKHAALLLTLADKVEREGQEREAAAGQALRRNNERPQSNGY
jgi:hypothetical protein